MEKSVVGIDGCLVGWVVVTSSLTGDGGCNVDVVADLSWLIRDLDSGRLAAAAIDIPIGLPACTSRLCDVEARKLIGPRRNSVFPAPVRSVLGAEGYSDAVARSRKMCGKGLSRQAFNILPKIEEVDALVTPGRQRIMVETHPEVSFTVLAGRPMARHKSKPEGRAERLASLRTVFGDVDDHAGRRFAGTQPGDVLDAFVAAWTARRYALGFHRQLGGDTDERGLRMEIIA